MQTTMERRRAPCTAEDALKYNMAEVQRRLESLQRALDENDAVTRLHASQKGEEPHQFLREVPLNESTLVDSVKNVQRKRQTHLNGASPAAVLHMVQRAKAASAHHHVDPRPVVEQGVETQQSALLLTRDPPRCESREPGITSPSFRAEERANADTPPSAKQNALSPYGVVYTATRRLQKHAEQGLHSPFPKPPTAEKAEDDAMSYHSDDDAPVADEGVSHDGSSPLPKDPWCSHENNVNGDGVQNASSSSVPYSSTTAEPADQNRLLAEDTTFQIPDPKHEAHRSRLVQDRLRPMEPSNTRVTQVTGAELFALLRMRGFIASRTTETGEHLLPSTLCHTMLVSEEEFEQLLALRLSLAADECRKSTKQTRSEKSPSSRAHSHSQFTTNVSPRATNSSSRASSIKKTTTLITGAGSVDRSEAASAKKYKARWEL